MKKYLLLVFLILSYLFAQSQNDCTKIKKVIYELRGETTYSTPATGESGIAFNRVITKQFKSISINASVDQRSAIYLTRGLFIKLSNGVIIKDEQATAPPHYIGEGKYRYYATLTLSDEQIDLLSKNTIVKYGVGNIELDVNAKLAAKYNGWMNCLISSY